MGKHDAYQPAGAGMVGRQGGRFTLRRWAVRHARGLEWVYVSLANLFLRLDPLWRLLGYDRIERPMVVVERGVKGFLFDCRMCGQCVLSATGMACPMNCPKSLRNGPCGGVRANGNCEVEDEMPCVWTEAWKGSRMMRQGDLILGVQKPIDHSQRETSAWLRATSSAARKRDRS